MRRSEWLILFATSFIGVQAQSRPSAPAAVVAKLYADFACEAADDAHGCTRGHELIDQPKAVLSRYFDPRLVRLWLADRACAAKSQEICNLDFAPLWASQDPEGITVQILPAADSAHVDVELRTPHASSPRVLRYSLIRTPGGWRIHDISFGREWSLVALLSRRH